jgi:hypothetical protein
VVTSIHLTHNKEKYHLDKKEPTLVKLAKIVRGADTPNRALTPQSEGLIAIATGFSLISKDDYEIIAKQCYVYYSLLAYCKSDKKVISSSH